MPATLEKQGARAMAAVDSRRRSRRDILQAPASLWESPRPDSTSGRYVWVYNLSLGGVGFRTQRPVDPTVLHYLRLTAGPLRLEARLRIVWSRRRDDSTIEVGAAFVKDDAD